MTEATRAPGGRWMNRAVTASQWIAVASMVVMFLAILFNVAARFLFNKPIIFAPNLAQILVPVVMFVGTSATLRAKLHPSADVAYRSLPKKGQNILLIVDFILAIGILGIYIWSSTSLFINSVQTRMGVDFLSFLPVALFQGLMLLGCLLFAVSLFFYVGRAVRNLAAKSYSGELY